MRDRQRDRTHRHWSKAGCLSLTLLLLSWGHPSVAEDVTPTAPTVDELPLSAFSATRLVDATPPPYPEAARLDGREGWVVLDCVVDEAGTLTDVTVRASTGQQAFEVAAVAWMRGNRFEPARIGDQSVGSSFAYKVTFRLTGDAQGARPDFVRAYRRFQGAIAAKDRAAAEAELARLDVENLYEDAYFHLARYWFATRWEGATQQIDSLKAAIANEKSARYLPREAFTAAARALFALQIAQNDFGAAMASFELLDPAAQAEPGIANAAATLRALETDTRAFRTQGTIETRGFWSTRLLKRRFSIVPGTGVVSNFRLRCERHYIMAKLDPELTYTRSTRAGNCEIEILGAPGSTFTLVQS